MRNAVREKVFWKTNSLENSLCENRFSGKTYFIQSPPALDEKASADIGLGSLFAQNGQL